MIPGTSPHLKNETVEPKAEIGRLAECAPDAEAPQTLWGRIEASIDQEQSSPGISAIRAQDGDWKPYPNGVWKKIISTRPDGLQMYLVRCEPGACITGHHHKTVEQVFVLEGDFMMNGTLFKAGDGQISAANSDHPDIISERGCLLLIVA